MHSFAVAVQKEHIESLRNKYQVMQQALETSNYDSMAQFCETPGVVDNEDYISVLRARTPRPTLMLPRTIQQRFDYPDAPISVNTAKSNFINSCLMYGLHDLQAGQHLKA
ncbi:hypothetical protein HPB52_021345 [Rhipicephalus sanguineus]|uniref:Uncharacterized protein n=1 Tax=Rhipicephalus sanguineus TaxID=34632 RepID=A0A9D4SPN9_RHISA|nr:hypothetical protein HPB52_021345 [Rhipicephalus sanguineus]